MIAAVTGASGHIGANLIRALIEQKHEVRALYHLNNKAFEGLDISLVKGSLENQESLNELCNGSDIVFHLAAQISIGKTDLKQLLKVNVEGTENVIKACQKGSVKRMVHFSSIHALNPGHPEAVMDENNAVSLESSSPYERTKAMAEKMAIDTAQSNGLEIIIVNPTAVIGPLDYEPSYLGQFLIRLVKGKIPGLIEGGYNWVDVRDVAQGAISAAKNGRNGEKYILSGSWVNLSDLTQLAGKASNKILKLPMFPGILARIGLPFLQIWARINKQHPLYTLEALDILKNGNRNISHNKASEELNYTSRPMLITLKDTYKWYQTNNYI
ncbi:MAG: NAD-dependent epimerase/dehydratase family protein [Bacteroidales bacterium]|nr:NAD-dependent epimerase/dehydratase family protein [Bacteroidales bacterium]